MDYILFNSTLLEQEKDKLKTVVTRTENLSVSYKKLGTKYYKTSKNT